MFLILCCEKGATCLVGRDAPCVLALDKGAEKGAAEKGATYLVGRPRPPRLWSHHSTPVDLRQGLSPPRVSGRSQLEASLTAPVPRL